jgi:hypothetical protein
MLEVTTGSEYRKPCWRADMFEFSDRHDDNDFTDGVAQGVSSDLTGATGNTPVQTNSDPERPKGLPNPEVRNE